MTLIPFSKEQLPKLGSAQLEAINQRISVRAVAASNVAMAAERSFPAVTLDDSLIEALHEQQPIVPADISSAPETEAVSTPDNVHQLSPEGQKAVAAATPALLETTKSREEAARERIAALFGERAA